MSLLSTPPVAGHSDVVSVTIVVPFLECIRQYIVVVSGSFHLAIKSHEPTAVWMSIECVMRSGASWETMPEFVYPLTC